MMGPNKTDFVPSAYYGTPHAIAIDWISRNIFWTNSKRNSIEVIKMDGDIHHRTTILTKTVDVDIGDPIALCAEPSRGLVITFCLFNSSYSLMYQTFHLCHMSANHEYKYKPDNEYKSEYE